MFSLSKHLRSTIRRSTFGKLHCKQCSTKQTNIHHLQTDNSSPIKRFELYGQPTPETHPHIMKPGELSPGIEPSEFADRRNRLMEKILTNPKNQYHLAVIPSAPKVYMTEKIPYVFRQNSDFFYLTGCLEPDSVLVMCGNTFENYSSTLFVRKRDPHSELWDGPRTGAERAAGFFGVNQSLPVSELRAFLTSYLKLYPSAVLWYDYFSNIHNAVHNTMNVILEESKGKQSWESPRDYIHNLRLIKSPAEQRLMQESCNIASDAIAKAMSVSKPGITEHQLFATVDYECRMNGAEILAYPPVVAAGNNATIIHYINNTQQTQSGDLVLMDAGCEYHGYISDITRTWPVNGKFTDPQRVLYEVILAVQLQLIQLCHNLPTLDSLFQSMCKLLGTKLKEAGVFSSNTPDDKLAKIAYEFCPHHVSHYLGMDVHDTALITRNIRMQPGMVLTIEPGIYVSHHNDLARPEFKGLGIRIEDDILITESGPHVLTAKCPKEISEVEKIVTSVT